MIICNMYLFCICREILKQKNAYFKNDIFCMQLFIIEFNLNTSFTATYLMKKNLKMQYNVPPKFIFVKIKKNVLLDNLLRVSGVNILTKSIKHKKFDRLFRVRNLKKNVLFIYNLRKFNTRFLLSFLILNEKKVFRINKYIFTSV